MTHHLTLSVVIPSFNQGSFLASTLASIISQEEPYEIIVIDGGSSDGTVQLLESSSSRLSYWISESDKGMSEALNKGLARATGEFVGWQNADDLYKAGAFSSFRRKLEADRRAGFRADVYHGHGDVIDENGTILYRSFCYPFDKNELLCYGYSFSNHSMFFRREMLNAIRGWDTDFRFVMDADLFLRLAASGAKFRFVNEVWGSFRLHRNSMSCSPSWRKVRNAEWRRLMERQHPAWSQFNPWDRRMPLRRVLYLLRRHSLMMVYGNWHRWALDKWLATRAGLLTDFR